MLLSKAELEQCAQTHPEVAAFQAKYPQPPPSTDPLAARRALRGFIEANLKRLGPAPSDCEEFYHDVEMRDGFRSSAKICRPAKAQPGPLIVLLFGGGFIGGDNDQLTETARICARSFGATVVNISYRCGPEYKFPFAQHDAWDNLYWIAENATTPLLAADPTKGFIIGGVSAGAAIAAALSRKFQEESLAYPLTGQWLAAPSLMHSGCCPPEYKSRFISLEQNSSTSSSLAKESLRMMMDAVQWDRDSDLRYAANSKTPLAGQPKTFLQVCGQDPLRDDGLVYEEMLKSAGVPTKLDLYPGCPHAHWASMRGLAVANRALIDTIVGIGWLMGTEVARPMAAEAWKIALA
ncbi:hypothetical protein CKM354_000020500 [Cercospora kikuchii]|uniref:Alpha/beta hydrolase fold-3 domain-containing protein n=1 Tax=Cercospora kikuchii TaxID=84275 RepID=A0A9P3F7K1_9PEZI|nr:uncharacterized protein CKM354_000020500 [Cercospora kikuchii]GIZ36738.1 hypothetical protein CKM354_000020500 [Cercospora kikuchii]